MRTRARGFLTADVVFATAIVLILLIVLATAMSWQQRAAARFGDTRAACREAERTLLALHQGIARSRPEVGTKVDVQPVVGGQLVPGYSWVKATATRNGRSVTLIGLSQNLRGIP